MEDLNKLIDNTIHPEDLNTDLECTLNSKSTSNYDTLVLSGASQKGFLILGALQYAFDNFFLNEINIFIGT